MVLNDTEWYSMVISGIPLALFVRGISLQIGVCICAVSTADAVATGEVNCYNCIIRLCTIQVYGDVRRGGV